VITLCRIDDRLIHGQVVVGWGGTRTLDRIVVVDDALRHEEWEQDIYRSGVAPGVEVEFADRAEAAARLPAWEASPERIFLLAGDVATMTDLVIGSEGLLTTVNLGGIHEGPGRRAHLRYVYLSEDEVAQLRRLEAAGVRISAQDLPTATPVSLHELLR